MKNSQSLELSADEWLGINNALNEVCNGVDIDDAEFQTRLGVDRVFLLVLLQKIGAIIPSDAS